MGGRKKRHSARTGDGGAELRLKKAQLAQAARAQKEAELEFHDDPSENEHASGDEVDSDEEDNEQEVLQLGGDDDEDSDDDDDDDDDAEAVDDDDDDNEMEDMEDEKKQIMMMDGKWGKSKKNFYSADTAEFEVDSDDEAAQDEEEAALELQRKQADMMDDDDFGVAPSDEDEDEEDDEEQNDNAPVDDEALVGEQLADISMLADEARGASIEQVQKDFSKMTKKEKLQIVNQSAPELLGLMAELESTTNELKTVVTPAIHKLSAVRRKTKAFNTGLQYLITRQNLMLNYVSNISFYLLLRAEGKSVTDHPVLEHLLVLKKQMNKMQDLDESVEQQLQELLTKDFPEEEADDGMDQFFKSNKKGKRSSSVQETAAAASASGKKQKTTQSSVSEAEKAEAARFYEESAKAKATLKKTKQELYTHEKPGLESSDEEDSDLEGGKRGATYEIMKNKGLKAHKSKLNRNPRLKKRMQFRKAQIRRKGQVRDVRVGEAGKYGGETTGIKSNLTRSRKIRN